MASSRDRLLVDHPAATPCQRCANTATPPAARTIANRRRRGRVDLLDVVRATGVEQLPERLVHRRDDARAHQRARQVRMTGAPPGRQQGEHRVASTGTRRRPSLVHQAQRATRSVRSRSCSARSPVLRVEPGTRAGAPRWPSRRRAPAPRRELGPPHERLPAGAPPLPRSTARGVVVGQRENVQAGRRGRRHHRQASRCHPRRLSGCAGRCADGPSAKD